MTELFFVVVSARPSDVNMKMIAAPVVNLRQEALRAPGAENGLRRAAEGRADIRALAFLQKDHRDQDGRDDDMK